MTFRYGKKIQEFVLPLIKLTHQNSAYPECLINVGGKLSKTEFNNNVYPVLAAMAPYNEYLSADTKRPLVNALQNGLLSRESNRICIMALTGMLAHPYSRLISHCTVVSRFSGLSLVMFFYTIGRES